LRLDDELFVNRCLQGDQAAFTCLVSKYKEMVHAYAYYKVGDYQEAQDIAQEVFIKAYSKLGQLKWPHRFQSWLYSIVANECKMWLRKRSKDRERETPLEDVPADELSGLAMRPHDDEDMEENVIVAMESLPADNQLALSLYYMSNLSIKEIAYFLGTSPGNVKVKLHRARKQLGERLENMLGKQLGKKKLRSGLIVTVVNSIRDMPIPSLLKPRPTKWMPIPISIGLALLIGIIGFGISSGKDVPPDMPILKPAEATFEVSLLPDPDRQTILDMKPENISDMVAANVGDPQQTQPATGTESSGIVVRRLRVELGHVDGSFSPDGRYYSDVNWKTGGNLAIYDLETGAKRDVTDEGHSGSAQASIWSPDGKQIAYLWSKGPDISLRIVGIDGSRPRVLYSSPAETEVLVPRTWSRDGKHILALHWKGKSKTRDIVLMSVADGSIRVLKSLGNYLFRMSLSPDGRYVAYKSPQNEGDISLLATNGSYETTLVKHPAEDFAPVWVSDGNRIVFVSDRSGSLGIWVLKVVDGKPKGSPQLIKQNLDGMWPLGLTQDGSYYYVRPAFNTDVYVATLDPETGEVVIPPAKAIHSFEGFNGHSAFSPDGKYLAYISQRLRGTSYFRALVIHSLETGEERVISPKNMELTHFPCWSPDGRSILASSTDLAIYQIDTETGVVTLVVRKNEQGAISAPPAWFPDGSKITFKRHGVIRIYDFETKQEWKPDFQLVCGDKDDGAGLALSPDGQQLAFMIGCDNEWSLQIAPSSGGDTREVIRLSKEETAGGRGLTWSPDGRHLLFLGKPKDDATGLGELWRIPVEGGALQNLGLKMKSYGAHLSFHPDGRRIAFTGAGPDSGSGPEVWAIENFLPKFTASR